MKYAVILPTLNGDRTIRNALESILDQTVKPSIVCVVDGGSSDGTWHQIQEYACRYPDVLIIRRNNLADKHAIVIVHHYNLALSCLDGHDFDYYFFHADDCVFPSTYVEELASKMKTDLVDIASGDWGFAKHGPSTKAPQGAGRMVSGNVMKAIHHRFPAMYGYESWVLHKAEQLGFTLRCYEDIRFQLLNPLGLEAWHPTPDDTPDMPQGGHVFYEWGRAMRCLGYHPLYVLLRLLSDLLWNRAIPKRYGLRIAWDYFATFWDRHARADPYCNFKSDPPYRKHMSRKQLIMVARAITFPLRKI
jgi:glycosyltransferase involved in cell wall biosynthesis